MVVAPLEAERGPARARNFGAARAAAAMGRKDRYVIGEREHAVAERVVRRACELVRELWTEQIDARDLTDEERPAGEEILRIVGSTEIRNEIGDMLGGVARRRDATDRELADVDDVRVPVRCVRKRERGVVARVHRDRSKLRQGARARHVVVVDVRFE